MAAVAASSPDIQCFPNSSAPALLASFCWPARGVCWDAALRGPTPLSTALLQFVPSKHPIDYVPCTCTCNLLLYLVVLHPPPQSTYHYCVQPSLFPWFKVLYMLHLISATSHC
ncbi:hypothetical protein BDZ91DRAFT_753887 [Kalaharituber pfeilii]|nr:hypothetical protein BDZ91DRAFT_753887 [Kalaharituber pfeilii]